MGEELKSLGLVVGGVAAMFGLSWLRSRVRSQSAVEQDIAEVTYSALKKYPEKLVEMAMPVQTGIVKVGTAILGKEAA